MAVARTVFPQHSLPREGSAMGARHSKNDAGVSPTALLADADTRDRRTGCPVYVAPSYSSNGFAWLEGREQQIGLDIF